MRLGPLPQQHSSALADEFASFHKTLGFVPNSVLPMEEPLAIGRKHLARQGWSPVAHLR
jgi:hypothetical protein